MFHAGVVSCSLYGYVSIFIIIFQFFIQTRLLYVYESILNRINISVFYLGIGIVHLLTRSTTIKKVLMAFMFFFIMSLFESFIIGFPDVN